MKHGQKKPDRRQTRAWFLLHCTTYRPTLQLYTGRDPHGDGTVQLGARINKWCVKIMERKNYVR